MCESKQVFITGVSRGIGLGLAKRYLDLGAEVCGLSRTAPESLLAHDRFRFQSCDLEKIDQIPAALEDLLKERNPIDLVILNAGVLGQFGDLAETPLTDLARTMQVNVWSNKVVLDWLFAQSFEIGQVVTISSGASVNGNRGWSGYGISKAALNMFTKLYAKEQSATHFTALAPGVVDTVIQDNLLSRERDERFPALEILRSKRGTADMPDPETAAERLVNTIARLPNLMESGNYADVRKPPLSE